MITASLVDLYTYEVVVDGAQGGTETTHTVVLRPEYYIRLCGGTITHEWLIIQSFKFLLEREPNTAILRHFDLEVIASYFPEYEAEIAARIGWSGR